ncbi:MAG: 3-deoxy-7-phosphoheptulonate synthase [Desulfobacterales bacterium]|nr:3-deoxy-7-phosphoheptulonate synthase [Desulfobacterales bacterium]
MLVVMDINAKQELIDAVVETAENKGYKAMPIPGGDRVSIGILYNKGSVDKSHFLGFEGVKEVIPVTKPYKQVSREFKNENTIIKVGDIQIGGDEITIIAGPCAIESEKQAMDIALSVKEAGATLFRGGAYKPRSSPYSFQGMGIGGLKILSKVREETGLPVVSEVIDLEVFDAVEDYVDVLQIGTRNMQNFSLLKRAGKAKKPVILKRGMAATIEEWLMAAEYIMENGNPDIILCERGVRTFVNHSRNTLDISAIPVVQKESHLPIITDPSHAAGVRDQVLPLSLASVAAETDGLMIEVHNKPEEALCDGAQSLLPEQFDMLCKKVRKMKELCRE